MSTDKLYESIPAGSRTVYVVESHHCILLPWSIVRRLLQRPPNLITLDHHTDTRPAFVSYASRQCGQDESARLRFQEQLIKEIDWRSDDSVAAAIYKLKYDEHIHAATACGILDHAFSIQLSSTGGTRSREEAAYLEARFSTFPPRTDVEAPKRPFTYDPPPNRIFEVPHRCAVGCKKSPHDDRCVRKHYNQVLESVYLEDQLQRTADMTRSIGNGPAEQEPYILDIDLDYFHTEKSVWPKDPTTFERLIRNAQAITIARESSCVNGLKLPREKIDADSLLSAVLTHVARACPAPSQR